MGRARYDGEKTGAARELAPLAKEDPEAAAEVWEQAVEDVGEAGGKVTARDIREHTSPARPEKDNGALQMYAAHGKLPSEMDTRIKRVIKAGAMDYLVEFMDERKHYVGRRRLLDAGWKKCKCCGGHGIERPDLD